MNYEGYQAVQAALDERVGKGAALIHGAPYRTNSPEAHFVELVPTGCQFIEGQDEPVPTNCIAPRIFLNALAVGGFMAAEGEIPAQTPANRLPRFLLQGIYVQPPANQFDTPYPRILLRDNNVPLPASPNTEG
jgi:hypothetical protein